MSGSSTNRFTSEGNNRGDFDPGDWALLLATAGIWGSSFLWIAIGLDSFHPGVIACGRMLFGAAVLWFVPTARTKLPRSTWPALVVITLAGNMAPAVFFPLAQQRIESSVAGMLNSMGPIIVLLISAAMLRKFPERQQVGGLILGLIGAVAIALPNLAGADAEPLGVLYVVFAVIGYSISNNLLPPLAQAYGGPAIMARAMLASAVILAPWGVWGAGRSSFSWASFAALAALGVFGTGIARSMFATLNGRIGAPRSALVGYLVPVVAVVLGVVVRNETVGAVELVGTVLILAGAGLISRSRR